MDFILPGGCVSCRRWVPASDEAAGPERLICFGCRARLRPGSWPRCPRCHAPRGTGRAPDSECLECRGWPGALSAARYAWTLVPPATDLVHALKYEGWRELARFMGRSMTEAVAAAEGTAVSALLPWVAFASDAVVVPVATTAARARSRGYNQASLLADVVGSGLGRPVQEDALARAATRESQTALAPDERWENVRGAFEAGAGAGLIVGRRVLLVDDVLTTGATAAEAAKVLRDGGADEIRLLTFARAFPEGADREAAA